MKKIDVGEQCMEQGRSKCGVHMNVDVSAAEGVQVDITEPEGQTIVDLGNGQLRLAGTEQVHPKPLLPRRPS